MQLCFNKAWLGFFTTIFAGFIGLATGEKNVLLTSYVSEVVCNQLDHYQSHDQIPSPVLWKSDGNVGCGNFGWRRCDGETCAPFAFKPCEPSDDYNNFGRSADDDRNLGAKNSEDGFIEPSTEMIGKHAESLRLLEGLENSDPDFESKIQPALQLFQGFFDLEAVQGNREEAFIGRNYGFLSAAEKDEFFQRVKAGLELTQEYKGITTNSTAGGSAGSKSVEIQSGIEMVAGLLKRQTPGLDLEPGAESVFKSGEDFFAEFGGAIDFIKGLFRTGAAGEVTASNGIDKSVGDLFGAEDEEFAPDIDPANVFKFNVLLQTGLQFLRGLKEDAGIGTLLKTVLSGMEKLQGAIRGGQLNAPGISGRNSFVRSNADKNSNALKLLDKALQILKGWTSSIRSTSPGIKTGIDEFFDGTRDSLGWIKVLYFLGGCALKEEGSQLLHDVETPKKGTRIVGGQNANKYKYPSIVLLNIRGNQACAGTILTSQWVMTAAHCVTSKKAKNFQFVAGEYNLDRMEGHEQERQAVKIVVHPKYNDKTVINDIALFKVSPAFELNEKVRAAKLPKETFNPKDGTLVWVAGWGRLSDGGETADILQEVSVPLISVSNCKRTYKKQSNEYVIQDTNICAGYEQGGKDACQGDSGGPMYYVNSEGKKGVIGVVSWGESCADKRFPGVYTRVTSYLNWIGSTIEDDGAAGRGAMKVKTEISRVRYASIVAILSNGVRICAGTILSPNWVLTAAHCLTSVSGSLEVVPAEDDEDEGERHTASVAQIVLHDQYNPATKANDIAMLKLNPKLQFSPTRVQQAILPPKGYQPKGNHVLSVGWAKSTRPEKKGYSEVLEAVKMDTTSPKVCADWLEEPGLLKEKIVCVWFSNTSADVCQDQGGSPLYAKKGEKLYIVGVASMGENCSNGNNPRVYTKVSKYQDWIQAQISEKRSYAPPMHRSALSRNFTGRIAGGRDSKKHNYPSIVLMLHKGTSVCAGTIINKNWVLTAAHCVEGRIAQEYQFIAGEHDLGKSTGKEKIVTADKFVVHPRYKQKTIENDIALFKVNPAFTFNAQIQPAALPGKKFVAKAGTSVWLAGWGALNFEGDTPEILQEVSIPIIDPPTCRKMLSEINPNIVLNPNQICAGLAKGGKDACQGDSGGPMYLITGKKQVLLGVVSWGMMCAEENSPGIYTKVSSYIDWISATVKKN